MWQIAGYSALAVAVICLVVTGLKPTLYSGDLADPDLASDNADNDVNSENNDREETLIKELRDIVRRCQSENKPPMSEVRENLEKLSQKLSSPAP